MNCLSYLSNRFLLTPWQQIVIVSISVPLFLAAVIFNLSLIISLIKTKKLTNTSKYLIMILSLSDCMTGCTIVPLAIVSFTKYQRQQVCQLEIPAQFLAFLFAFISYFMVILLAIDRYINIDPNLRHVNSRTQWCFSCPGVKFLVSTAIFLSIAISAAITVASAVSWYYLFIAVLCSTNFLLMLIPTILYAHAYVKIKRHIRTSRIYIHNTNEDNRANNRISIYNKFGTTIFLLLLCFLIFYVPQLIIAIYTCVLLQTGSKLNQTQIFLLSFTMLVSHLNSVVNALLIIHRDTKIKGYIFSSLRYTFSRRDIYRPETAEPNHRQTSLQQKTSV